MVANWSKNALSFDKPSLLDSSSRLASCSENTIAQRGFFKGLRMSRYFDNSNIRTNRPHSEFKTVGNGGLCGKTQTLIKRCVMRLYCRGWINGATATWIFAKFNLRNA